MQKSKSIRIIFLTTLLASIFLFSNQAHARISISYHNGHYGHGYGHYKHYRHYNNHAYYGHRYYKKRHYYPTYYYRHNYSHSYRYPYKYRRHNYYSYRPHKYSYKPYRYSYNNYRHSYSSGSYSSSYIKPIKQIQAYHNSNDAWTSLVNGQTSSALTQFGSEAQAYPNAGLPKAGVALALATSGKLDKGVWAMRRAFQYDPDSLHQITKDSRLQYTFDNLIAKYEYPLQHRGRHQDEAFMVAALNYLKGDYAAAEQAAAIAAKDGDRSTSFKNLRHLLAKNSTQHNY